MKIVFTLLLTCWVAHSMAQVDTIKIGDKKFKTVLHANGFTIYSASCENSDDYHFVGRSAIRYDSLQQAGYLRSYNYTDSFYCREQVDHSLAEQIKNLLSEKANVHNRTGILFSMEDKNKEFIAVLYLFKNKKFKKFAKKASKLKTREYSAEKILVREYDYHRYARQFILAKTADKLSLIPVSKLKEAQSVQN